MISLKDKVKKLPEKNATRTNWVTSLDKAVLTEINDLIVSVNNKDPEVTSRLPSNAALYQWLKDEGVINVSITAFRDYARVINAKRQAEITSGRGKNRS